MLRKWIDKVLTKIPTIGNIVEIKYLIGSLKQLVTGYVLRIAMDNETHSIKVLLLLKSELEVIKLRANRLMIQTAYKNNHNGVGYITAGDFKPCSNHAHNLVRANVLTVTQAGTNVVLAITDREIEKAEKRAQDRKDIVQRKAFKPTFKKRLALFLSRFVPNWL